MALIGLELCQNPFQTIPHTSFSIPKNNFFWFSFKINWHGNANAFFGGRVNGHLKFAKKRFFFVFVFASFSVRVRFVFASFSFCFRFVFVFLAVVTLLLHGGVHNVSPSYPGLPLTDDSISYSIKGLLFCRMDVAWVMLALPLPPPNPAWS